MDNSPLVSVIIPTYNRSEYIERAIDSIRNQTYKNIEIIVVDDNLAGSIEQKKTVEKLEKYKNYGQFIYLCTAGQIGGGAARNYAIKYCKGEYVTFLDDDDKYLPDKIAHQIQFMQDNNLDMSYEDIQWFDKNEKLIELRKMDRVNEFTKEGLLKAHITYAISPTSIYMIRREALLRTEGFGETKRGQDWILMLRCIEAGLKIGYLPEVQVVQYLHEGERISVGNQFIEAQTCIYNIMKQYENILSPKEKRYVDFRYYCVCAFASLRGKKIGLAIVYGIRALFKSPIDCLKESLRYFGNRRS